MSCSFLFLGVGRRDGAHGLLLFVVKKLKGHSMNSDRPYIGDDAVQDAQQQVNASYLEANQPVDNVRSCVWICRAQHRFYAEGKSWDTALAISIRDLRKQLGLPFEDAPPVVLLPKLVARGKFFGLETGERWTAIECSDFHLYGRYLSGEDVRPLLEQRRDVGFNLLRVWTLYDLPAKSDTDPGVGVLRDPQYDRLPAFCNLVGSYGLYLELVGYTGIPDLLHWERLGLALIDGAVTNVIVELANENAFYPSNINPNAFQPIPGFLCCHTDCGEAVAPWQWGAAHYNASGPEWTRKVGHNTMEDIADVLNIPGLANENPRYPDNQTSPDKAYDAAAAAALLCAGACFHSVRGKTSELWAGVELAGAQAWANGARSVPLEFQDGSYRHPIEDEGPGDLRVYQRVLADGRRHTVRIRR